ncbi:MAG: hypothetical protein JSS93_12465 [Bacteroidetes bacterium]|nr:hypothetical protein [Bacteroidota bacterium]
MKPLFVLLTCLFFQQDIPLKPANEFRVDINLKYKEKPSSYGSSTYNTNGERMDKTEGQQPFLSVRISEIKINEDEKRISVAGLDGKEIIRKKTDHLSEVSFDMGFISDLKADASTYTIYFLSADKKRIKKIILSIAPTGIFTVNGQWHGQF